MIINKKYTVMILLVAVFGQTTAMKRGLELTTSSSDVPSIKRIKIGSFAEGMSTESAPFIIPSTFSSANQIRPTFKNTSYVSVSNEKKELSLEISVKEQSSFCDKQVFPYHDLKFSDALGKGDAKKVAFHMHALGKLHYTEEIVAEIVSNDALKWSEKKDLFNQLQKTTVDQSQVKIFNQPNMIGQTPLQLALMYDDGSNYELIHDLLSRGANPSHRDSKGRPVSFDAQNVEAVKLLTAFGGCKQYDQKTKRIVFETDNAQETLLFHNATMDPKDREIATWFITHGGRLDQKNSSGKTAYQEQLSRGYVNPDLEKEELAAVMVRKSLGINNPYLLRTIQAGKLRITMF